MTITIAQAKTIISTFVQQQLKKENPPPVFLWGPPGVGKSDIMREIAKEKGIDVIDVRLGQMDAVDMRGIPYVDNGVTKWAVPEFFPCAQDEEAILFLDELSSAEQAIQVAAYQLILERQVGEYKLPPKVYVCAAGNRAQDNAVSLPISSALANRMLHLEVEASPEAWCAWAVTVGIAPEVTSFIRFCPKMLFNLDKDCERGWASPRSWARVSEILSYGLDSDALRASIIGLVGESAAAQFLAYYKQSQALGDIRAVMLDPTSKWKLPTKNDMLFAVATSIAYWAWSGENKDESTKLLDGFFRIGLQLPAAFAAVAMVDAMSSGQDADTGKNKEGDARAMQLIGHKLYPEWQKKFSSEMKKKKGA